LANALSWFGKFSSKIIPACCRAGSTAKVVKRKMIEEITARIQQTLAKEEARVERSVIDIRFKLLLVFGVIAAVNARSVSVEANYANFGVFALACLYKLALFLLIRRRGYHPVIKYVTSFVDVALVYLLMILHAQTEAPATALKNYAFTTFCACPKLRCFSSLLTFPAKVCRRR
jgi:hypothetical protein